MPVVRCNHLLLARPRCWGSGRGAVGVGSEMLCGYWHTVVGTAEATVGVQCQLTSAESAEEKELGGKCIQRALSYQNPQASPNSQVSKPMKQQCHLKNF